MRVCDISLNPFVIILESSELTYFFLKDFGIGFIGLGDEILN